MQRLRIDLFTYPHRTFSNSSTWATASKTRSIQFLGLETTGFHEFSIHYLLFGMQFTKLVLSVSGVCSSLRRGINSVTTISKTSGRSLLPLKLLELSYWLPSEQIEPLYVTLSSWLRFWRSRDVHYKTQTKKTPPTAASLRAQVSWSRLSLQG